MHLRTRRLALVLLGCALVVSGCAGAVRVSPDPTLAKTPACTSVLAAMPTWVDGGKRRSVTPSTAAAAAWGRTPIVMHCGVGLPVELLPTSELLTVNGIDWFAQQLSAGYRFTLANRTPTVQLDVPAKYSPETNALVDISGGIKKSTTLRPTFGN